MSSLAQEEADRFFTEKSHHTSHPEDRDDKDSLHSLDGEKQDSAVQHPSVLADDDEDTLHAMSTTTTSTATYRLPTTLFDNNTGPKGVIADAQSFNRAKKYSFRKTLANISSHAFSSSSQPPRKSSPDSDKENHSTSEHGSIDEEVDFMLQWRQNRLQELQSGNTLSQRRRSPSKRIWGTFDDVDANGYLDAVEKVPDDTVIVVCIYDPLSNESAAVEAGLAVLARKHLTTRFVKLDHEIAEMEHIGVPAVLAYRAGDVFATLPDCKPIGLEDTLRREGVLL